MTRNAIRSLPWFALALGMLIPALAQAQGPYSYYAVNPARAYDSRVSQGGPGPLAHDQTRNVTIQTVCGIPSGAKAAVLNLTAVTPTGPGYLTLFPQGTTKPLASSINFATGQIVGNGVLVKLGASTPDLSVYAAVEGAGTVEFVIDCMGYYQ